MQQAPNPEFYLCPTCNNQIRTQNRLMHEARCEFLRKTSSNQPPMNSYQPNQNSVLQMNPSYNYGPGQPFRQNHQASNVGARPMPQINNNGQSTEYINNRNNNNNPLPPQQQRPMNSLPNAYPPPNNLAFVQPPNRNINQNIQNPNERDSSQEQRLVFPLAMDKCDHCQSMVPRTFMGSHLNTCPGLVALCPVCNESYPLEILQEHINAEHIPIENPNERRRDSSPNFFTKIKNFFSSNDKKEKIKIVKCKNCNKSVSLETYESHIRVCARSQPVNNQLFSLMNNNNNARRRPFNANANRNALNELDVETRKMRELMLLMHLLLSQRVQEEKGLKNEEINDNTILCKYDVEKNASLIEDYKKCSICQCDFEQDEEIRILICLHRYHKECADAWLNKKSWCPLCRKNVRSGQEEEIKEDEDAN